MYYFAISNILEISELKCLIKYITMQIYTERILYNISSGENIFVTFPNMLFLITQKYH